ncbi:putative glycerol proton symporter of the plasma subject to glucose-induced inactivation [Phaeomoniella chlamydospora]|uniref:Putative glycerol proton symporter of the plasma subject to glucose-induced inactivation n=1 Tax=Phaeomoniella chlamydospora TaxID=158046 RepID=A0A0G2GUX7_PHACM|nr:putative glycerol proton symporter of the plasma subject to glucose-induced inactivation [Phaeomoniella chlamydospora]
MGRIATGISGNQLVALVTVANAASMAWFGYDQGVFSGVLISKDFVQHFPETNNANISGITTSCFSLGAFVGAVFAFTFGDTMGRKRTILLGTSCNIVGAVLQIAAYQFPMLIVGRIINGFGMGITSSTCPVYQAECTKPSIRGKLVVVGSMSNTAAFCLANWMNYGLYFNGSGAMQWRFPLGFQLIFPIAVLMVLPFIPDSPRWLILKERGDEAVVVISRLLGKNLAVDDPAVVSEFLSIQTTLRDERYDAARTTTKDVLTFKDKAQNLRRVLLSCGTQLMQQFSGVNALGYYLPTLLEESVGFDEQMARLLSACNGTSYLFAAMCCLLLIDLVGRRKLMLYGALTCGSWYLIAALCLRQAEVEPEKKYQFGAATTAMFFLYYFSYGTSFAKVPWVYNSEINSFGWRARGAAAATGTNWISSFCVAQFTKPGVLHLHWRFYLIFSIICYSYFPIVFAIYPETSQRTLEDMDYIFESNPGPFVFRKREITQRRRPQAFINAELRRIEAGKNSQDTEQNFNQAKDTTTTLHVETSV